MHFAGTADLLLQQLQRRAASIDGTELARRRVRFVGCHSVPVLSVRQRIFDSSERVATVLMLIDEIVELHTQLFESVGVRVLQVGLLALQPLLALFELRQIAPCVFFAGRFDLDCLLARCALVLAFFDFAPRAGRRLFGFGQPSGQRRMLCAKLFEALLRVSQPVALRGGGLA